MLKVARNAFNIGEALNPVCCHGNKSFYCAAPLVEPTAKNQTFLLQIGRDIFFSSYLIKIWLSI